MQLSEVYDELLDILLPGEKILEMTTNSSLMDTCSIPGNFWNSQMEYGGPLRSFDHSYDDNKIYSGHLCISNYRVMFICEVFMPLFSLVVIGANSVGQTVPSFAVPLFNIQSCTKVGGKSSSRLDLTLRSSVVIRIVFDNPSRPNVRSSLSPDDDLPPRSMSRRKSISALANSIPSFVVSSEQSTRGRLKFLIDQKRNASRLVSGAFCLEHRLDVEDEFSGWDMYDPVKEYIRLGVKVMPPPPFVYGAAKKGSKKKGQKAVSGRSFFGGFLFMGEYLTTPEKFKEREEDANAGEQMACGARSLSAMSWRVSYANVFYQVCSSYPGLLVVPVVVDNAMIADVAQFRSSGRIPALSWRCQASGVSLCRCAQPMVGITTKRSSADEMFIEEIRKVPPVRSKIYIFDCRPRVNVMANQMMGKGTESSKAYTNAKVVFLEIANIHVMRDSWNKIAEVFREQCNQRTWTSMDTPSAAQTPVYAPEPFDISKAALMSVDRQLEDLSDRVLGQFRPDKIQSLQEKNFLTRLDNSQWFNHLRSVIAGALQVCEALTTLRVHCLVHCSDGWDRTAQVTSLSMLLLDPYYRTLSGFIVLIEKEWTSFGHRFATRNQLIGSKSETDADIQQGDYVDDYGKRASTTLKAVELETSEESNLGFEDKQTSPIFVQWLDCVFQVLSQFPYEFEFNEYLLLFINYHLHSCRYGTFLFDCEMDRVSFSIPQRTLSIWKSVHENRGFFLNPEYRPLQKEGTFLRMSVAQRNIKLWEKMFCQHLVD